MEHINQTSNKNKNLILKHKKTQKNDPGLGFEPAPGPLKARRHTHSANPDIVK